MFKTYNIIDLAASDVSVGNDRFPGVPIFNAEKDDNLREICEKVDDAVQDLEPQSISAYVDDCGKILLTIELYDIIIRDKNNKLLDVIEAVDDATFRYNTEETLYLDLWLPGIWDFA